MDTPVSLLERLRDGAEEAAGRRLDRKGRRRPRAVGEAAEGGPLAQLAGRRPF